MPNLPTANPAQFLQGAPLLQVPDVLDTVAYYTRALGFLSDFGDADYAVVWRDNAAIHFMKGEVAPTGVRLFLWLRDVDTYHAELVARGIPIAVAPANRPYGMRDFSVCDPNGISVIFGQDLNEEDNPVSP